MTATPVDYTMKNWVNNVANPAINETNLDAWETLLDKLSTYTREQPSKKVRAATTANITLSGTQTIDGVALTAGQRCFVKNQNTPAQNGIYVVSTTAWTRSTDADSEADFAGGTLISVQRGTSNGGRVYRCTNSGAITLNTTALTFEEVGAGGSGSGTPGVYDDDGTTPLKYSAFLAAASGNETAALQNAVNMLFSSAAFNKVLDLEGHTITLTQPVTIPATHSGGIKSIVDGEIEADVGFTGGDHMIRCQNVNNLYYMRLLNVTMNGNNVASWIYWDIGNWLIQTCNFKNSKAGTAGDTARLGTGYNRAGLFCSESGTATGDAGFWIDNCWFACDDGPTAPSSRWRWAIVSQTGDNKIGGGTTMSYFRHSLISEGPGLIIHGFHPFQGQTALGGAAMTSHTAVIKFTNGRCGAQVLGLYLGKGFMEISNESNTAQEDIGEIVITGMRAYMDNGVSNEAHIHARDYGAGNARCSDIVIKDSYFLNGGTVVTEATKLWNPANFNRDDYHGIYMGGNTFDTNASTDAYEVSPQANPVTLRRTFGTSNQSKSFGFTGFFPFSGRPRRLISAVAIPSSGNGAQCSQGTIVSDDINILSSSSWAGDLTATATCNNDRSTFVEGV